MNQDGTIGALVVENPLRARVFEKFGIDYCCGGKRKLAEVCSEKGIDTRSFMEAIAACDQLRDPLAMSNIESRISELSLSELVTHIEGVHHLYLKEELPRLMQLALKVAKVHGDKHPEVVELAQIFGVFKQELELHMMKEEQVLFPFIRKLDASKSMPTFHCGSLENPIKVMEFEHDQAGDALKKMRSLTSDYTLPEGACNSYRALFVGLEEMEKDLHQHVHEENNVLFIKSMEKERTLMR